jgi:hypothetical protein
MTNERTLVRGNMREQTPEPDVERINMESG